MRAGTPLQVEVRRFGAWHGAVTLLVALSVAGLARWWLSMPDDTPAWQRGLGASTALFSVVAALAARVPACRLRFDGHDWHLLLLHPPRGDEQAGRLGVALDLGVWLLLRFDPLPVSPAALPRWVPVQRRGLEGVWRALRRAVYSARPAAAAPFHHPPPEPADSARDHRPE